MNDNTPALVIKNLSKTYANGTKALSNVSLTVPAGDFYALLGPNGAGKTTIIGIATGLVNRTEGSVSVFGHDIDKEPEIAKAQIGLVGQEINFNPFEKPFDIVVNQGGLKKETGC
ncbi:ATP-binding cassette domain-containing protein [Candidatus Kaiserbacteria bacterium]|nr:ATP-binding cassette domain-containing protein [Candidatus Kaiserbacteria bacterium]